MSDRNAKPPKQDSPPRDKHISSWCSHLVATVVLLVAGTVSAESPKSEKADVDKLPKSRRAMLTDQEHNSAEDEPDKPAEPDKVEPEPQPKHYTWLANWLSQFSLKFPDDSQLFWDKGVRLYSADEKIKFKLGGKWMMDFTWASGHQLEKDLGINLHNSVRCRRVRPYIAGEFYDRLVFKIEADFTGAGTKLMDAHIQLRRIPYVGNVTVGHFNEPFGLEQLTSSASTTFLESALPDAFAPPRAWGVMANNHSSDKRMTWALGLFRDTDDECSGSATMGNACALTGRVTFLPLYEAKGRKLLHLGAGYSLRRPSDPVRFRSRPEARFVEYLADTGDIDADRVHLFSAEVAWVHGPFSLQGEYMGTAVDVSDSGGLCLNGFYVQGSYLLTGEHRPYDRHTGVFIGVKPNKNFLGKGGWGAWELAARYSFLDLDGPGLSDSARQVQDFTVGLNWYLTPNIRMGWNYIRSWIDGSEMTDAADIFLMRLQIAF